MSATRRCANQGARYNAHLVARSSLQARDVRSVGIFLDACLSCKGLGEACCPVIGVADGRLRVGSPLGCRTNGTTGTSPKEIRWHRVSAKRSRCTLHRATSLTNFTPYASSIKSERLLGFSTCGYSLEWCNKHKLQAILKRRNFSSYCAAVPLLHDTPPKPKG